MVTIEEDLKVDMEMLEVIEDVSNQLALHGDHSLVAEYNKHYLRNLCGDYVVLAITETIPWMYPANVMVRQVRVKQVLDKTVRLSSDEFTFWEFLIVDYTCCAAYKLII